MNGPGQIANHSSDVSTSSAVAASRPPGGDAAQRRSHPRCAISRSSIRVFMCFMVIEDVESSGFGFRLTKFDRHDAGT
jgi:hypothetical protein